MWTFVAPIPTELSRSGQNFAVKMMSLQIPETPAWNKPTKLIG